ncbi:MAG TPA: sigma-70 family RNA polymerase sigma factor [Bryobacteraceae bacterium]|nr:sigma-70 family RNA polymerase sigma factor [Bryobacteraceae bacterium]
MGSLMELSDTVAVAQARAGDPGAFRVLVERHSRNLFRLAYRMTGHQQDAEDVVQETFLRAYKQLSKFDERASFGTWLYRIASNYSLDLIRARKRRSEHYEPATEEGVPDPIQVVPDTAPTPDRLAASSEVERKVAAVLDELSEMERTAFVLRHYEGMCIDEIGRTLGVQPNAAKHSIFRAVQKLRHALEPLMSSAS